MYLRMVLFWDSSSYVSDIKTSDQSGKKNYFEQHATAVSNDDTTLPPSQHEFCMQTQSRAFHEALFMKGAHEIAW